MVHMTITSFHINLYADQSYLIDVDPPSPRQLLTAPKFIILKNTISVRYLPMKAAKTITYTDTDLVI